jgi:transposase-like protein
MQHGSVNTTASNYYGQYAQGKRCQTCNQQISSDNEYTGGFLVPTRAATDPTPQSQAVPPQCISRSNTAPVVTGRIDSRKPGVITLGERRHKCKDCSQEFTQLCNAYRHRSIAHRSGTKPRPVCKTCGKFFRSDNLKRHRKFGCSSQTEAAG